LNIIIYNIYAWNKFWHRLQQIWHWKTKAFFTVPQKIDSIDAYRSGNNIHKVMLKALFCRLTTTIGKGGLKQNTKKAHLGAFLNRYQN